MQPKLVAAAGEPREELVYREFLFICPLRNRVQQSPPSPSQICARLNAGGRGKQLSQIGIVKIRIRIFVKLALARVIGFKLNVKTIVIGDAILRRVHGWLARKRAHQLIKVLQFSYSRPARIIFAPVELRREPDRKRLGEIFVRMTLRVPILKVNNVTTAERPWPISVRRLLPRCLPKTLLPFFATRQLISVHVSVPRFVAH